ncbi:MAG: 30S ribosomal protein S9 [bacterium]
MTELKNKKNSYFYALGRRKTATATIRLFAGKGISTVDDVDIKEKYISSSELNTVLSPLTIIDKKSDFYFTAKVKGGGKTSQIGAIVLAMSRALVKADLEFKPVLKKAMFLMRDSRMVERKHTGHKKARKSEQYSKR